MVAYLYLDSIFSSAKIKPILDTVQRRLKTSIPLSSCGVVALLRKGKVTSAVGKRRRSRPQHDRYRN